MEEQYATQLAILSDIWNNLKRLPYIRHYERAIANLYDYVSSRAHLSSHLLLQHRAFSRSSTQQWNRTTSKNIWK